MIHHGAGYDRPKPVTTPLKMLLDTTGVGHSYTNEVPELYIRLGKREREREREPLEKQPKPSDLKLASLRI